MGPAFGPGPRGHATEGRCVGRHGAGAPRWRSGTGDRAAYPRTAEEVAALSARPPTTRPPVIKTRYQAPVARRTGPAAADLQAGPLFFLVNTGEMQAIYRGLPLDCTPVV